MLQPENFPLSAQALRNPDRFLAALAAIRNGSQEQRIYNVVLTEAKFVLNRVVDTVWEHHVERPFFHRGAWELHPEDVQALYHTLSVHGLHDILAASRKLAKTTATGPAVDSARAVAAELLPLAEAVAALKAHVIKGRVPAENPAAKPVNPNKVVKTCPCCFRQIAVVGGRMAHHGYRRPGHGWQTASCEGVRFPPLEESTEGLEWLIGVTREQLARDQEAYAKREAREVLNVRQGTRLVEVQRGSPEWPREFQIYEADLARGIRWLEADLVTLEGTLAKWQAMHGKTEMEQSSI